MPRLVDPAPWYLPPTREQMKTMAGKIGLKRFAPELLADLTNLASGGQIRSPSAVESEVAADAAERCRLSRSPQGGMTTNPEGIAVSTEQAAGQWKEFMTKYTNKVRDFLGSVPLDKVPGGSPLEKAAGLLKLLASMKSDDSSSGDGDEPLLPIFSDTGSGEGVAKTIEETVALESSLKDEEKAMLGVEDDSELGALQVAEDLLPGTANRVIIDISRKLDKMSPLGVHKSRKFIADPDGDELRLRPMRSLSEVSKIQSGSWAVYAKAPALFWNKALAGELPVRERGKFEEKRQLLFVLCDCSGSMEGEKHIRASGVVMNRLKAVITGEAEVWLGLFDGQLREPIKKASTPDEARKLLEKFRKANFSGGSTDIAAAIRRAAEIIKAEAQGLHKPDILVVTDEDSSSGNISPSELLGLRVHGFACLTDNTYLAKLTNATGGVYVGHF